MKTKKIILIPILCLALLSTALAAVLVPKALSDKAPESGDTPRFTLSAETAGPGEDVSVSVELSDNPGLMVMMLRVGYEPSVLTLTGVTGAGLSGWDRNGNTVLWLGNADSSYNGTILKLNFRVSPTAEAGETAVTLSCGRGDVGNHDEETFLPIFAAGSVTVQADGVPGGSGEAPQEELNAAELPFTDVPADAYYYGAVAWACQNGVTNGRSSDTFDPAGVCTRAEAVTFLWRAAGKPEPASLENPFEDVREGDYFYRAVLWAAERGITYGRDGSHFAPHKLCSTAEIVTFVYRAAGVGTDGWYGEAAEWANGAGLLNDTGLLVDPAEQCPRSAVVTFLYRAQSR